MLAKYASAQAQATCEGSSEAAPQPPTKDWGAEEEEEEKNKNMECRRAVMESQPGEISAGQGQQ